MEVIRLQEGEEVFHEGTSGDSWYVIFEGEVRVLKDADTEAESEIARLGHGKCFAEMAILDGMPRSASVRGSGTAEDLPLPSRSLRWVAGAGKSRRLQVRPTGRKSDA